MNKFVLIGMAVFVMALGSVAHAILYSEVASKDTTFESGDPDASMGDAPDARCYPEFNGGDPEGKGIRPSLFQWDLSSIPIGSTIISATLHLYLDNEGTPETVEDYRVSRLLPGKAWHESDGYYSPAPAGHTTWNDQIVGMAAWASPGAGLLDVDQTDHKYFDAVARPPSNPEDVLVALDVTSFVTEWVTNGVENNGVVLRGGTISGIVVGADRWTVGHRENPEPVERPYLEVEWVPEPATALLMALGFVPMMRRRRV